MNQARKSPSSKPWKIVYNWNDDEDEYLSQAEYEAFIGALEKDQSRVVLKDGRVLSVFCKKLVPNPDYTDPERAKQLELKYEMRREYLELKEQGKFDKVEDYVKWKKEQQDD